MKILEHALHCANRILVDPRLALAVRLSSVAVAVFLPAVALAYPGEAFILWARSSVVAPVCLFAIIGSLIMLMFRPQNAVLLLGVTIGALFVMWVMSNGAQITSQLQTSR